MNFITVRHTCGRASSIGINPQHGLEIVGILNHGDTVEVGTVEDCDLLIEYATQRKKNLLKIQMLDNDQKLKERG